MRVYESLFGLSCSLRDLTWSSTSPVGRILLSAPVLRAIVLPQTLRDNPSLTFFDPLMKPVPDGHIWPSQKSSHGPPTGYEAPGIVQSLDACAERRHLI